MRTPPRRRGTPKAPKFQSRQTPKGNGRPLSFGNQHPNFPAAPYTPSYTPPAVIPSTGTNAPSAAPGAPGLPVDPIFSNDIGTAQRTHDTSVSGLLTQRANTASAYGYTPTYDEQGLIRSLAVDPNNPYAKANLLRKSYTENQARTTNQMASRGQLYSGAFGVGQGINTENYQQGSNALQTAFINFIANNQGQINSAHTNYANSLAGADSERVARAVANDTGETAPLPQTPAQRAAANGTPRSSKPPKSRPGLGDLSNRSRYGRKK